jgi:steroid 5-alpha reductase family enzyme
MEKADKDAITGLLLALILAALIAMAGSQTGQTIASLPLFSICFALAFIIQWLAFIPAFIYQSERYFDLTGSITYLTVIVVAVVMSRPTDDRSLLLLGLVTLWAIRLGTFLFLRIRRAGEDRRFAELKPSFPRFLLTWTLQGLWVSLSLAAALAAVTSDLRIELGIFAGTGALVWIAGFALEAIADQQKKRFRADPANAGKFIQSGLWAWSRHPNYFGEIVLWIGVAIIAMPVLRGWQWATMISPFFIIVLLTRVSGIPMLEASADEKWGGQPDYEDYKSRTSELIPWPPAGKVHT